MTIRVVQWGTGPTGCAALRGILGHPDLHAADLLLLQEAEAEPGTGSDAARLATALGMGHVYAPAQEIDSGTRGLAILSRFPMQDIEIMYLDEPIDLDAAVPTAIAVVIETPRDRLRVINVHLDVALGIVDRVLQLRPAVLDAPARVVVAGDLPYLFEDQTGDDAGARAEQQTDRLVRDLHRFAAHQRLRRATTMSTTRVSTGSTHFGPPG